MSNPAEFAKQAVMELFGNLNGPRVMMGIKSVYSVQPDTENGILGGCILRYSSRLCSNKSNCCFLYIMEDGTRKLRFVKVDKFYRVTKEISVKSVENPANLESVWYENTACAVRMPAIIGITQKFPLGRVVGTFGAHETFTDEEVLACVNRHKMGDWGVLDEEDKATNEWALENGRRLLSKYEFPADSEHKEPRAMYIITEEDRSVTTVLLPEEY